jgi:hypothetical protein
MLAHITITVAKIVLVPVSVTSVNESFDRKNSNIGYVPYVSIYKSVNCFRINQANPNIFTFLNVFSTFLRLFTSSINKLCLICLFSKKACVFIKVGCFQKKIFTNTNIEQVIVIQLSSFFQSSYHCILLNLSLLIN